MGSCAPLRAAIGVRIVPPVAGHDSQSFTSARNAGSNSLVSFLFSKPRWCAAELAHAFVELRSAGRGSTVGAGDMRATARRHHQQRRQRPVPGLEPARQLEGEPRAKLWRRRRMARSDRERSRRKARRAAPATRRSSSPMRSSCPGRVAQALGTPGQGVAQLRNSPGPPPACGKQNRRVRACARDEKERKPALVLGNRRAHGVKPSPAGAS